MMSISLRKQLDTFLKNSAFARHSRLSQATLHDEVKRSYDKGLPCLKPHTVLKYSERFIPTSTERQELLNVILHSASASQIYRAETLQQKQNPKYKASEGRFIIDKQMVCVRFLFRGSFPGFGVI